MTMLSQLDIPVCRRKNMAKFRGSGHATNQTACLSDGIRHFSEGLAVDGASDHTAIIITY